VSTELAFQIYAVGVLVIGLGSSAFAGFHHDDDVLVFIPLALTWPLLAFLVLIVAPFWLAWTIGRALS
jgi:hypothetical protein